MTSKKTTAAAIESSLRAALPAALHAGLPELAGLIAAAASGELPPDDVSKQISTSNAFMPVLRELAGKDVNAGGVPIHFGGDEITVGNIQGSDAVAVGAGAVAIKLTISVSSASLPSRLIVPGLLLGGMLLIGAVLIIYQFARPFFAPLPRMSGNFNVAVARFGQSDEHGMISRSDAGDKMAKAVYGTLDDDLAKLTASIPDDRRTPGIESLLLDLADPIKGQNQEDREHAAARLASQIDADIVFYGTLDATGRVFTPEFYVAPRRLTRAYEATGSYPFGKPIRTNGDITANPSENAKMTMQITEQTRTLAQFIFGLGAFAASDYQQAAAHFDQAARTSGWEQGRELLLLFQGNTAGRLGDYEQALAFYNEALKPDPEYARAKLGLAAVRLQRAKGTCQPGNIDVAGLEETLQLYQQAAQSHLQPPLADIQTKATSGIGQVYLCLNAGGAGMYDSQARRAFEAVLADYEGNKNKRIEYLAAEAYANLGYLSLPAADISGAQAEGQYRSAAEFYQKALDLSSDVQVRPVYYRMLGFIHEHLGVYDLADEDYRNAIHEAPDDQTRQTYEELRRTLQQKRAGAATGQVTATP